MCALGIKKADGIEKIVEDYAKLDSDEKRGDIIVEGEMMFNGFESIMKAYQEIMGYHGRYGFSVQAAGIESQGYAKRLPALTPEQIEFFAQATAHYDAGSFIIGHFLSALIGRSYKAGFNDFRINAQTMAEPPDYFGYQLEGKKGNEIRIYIEGSVGRYCCYAGKGIRLKADEVGDDAGGAENTIIEAGKIGKFYARDISILCSVNNPLEKIAMMLASRIANTVYIIGTGKERKIGVSRWL